MQLNNPNTDSSSFEAFQNYFANNKPRNCKLLEGEAAGAIENHFRQFSLYAKTYSVVNIIEAAKRNDSHYCVHVKVDLGYKYDNQGQRDLGFEENIWWLSIQSSAEYGVIEVLPKQQRNSRVEIWLNNTLSFLRKKNSIVDAHPYYSFTYSSIEKLEAFLLLPNVCKLLKKHQPVYISCRGNVMCIGDYTNNLVQSFCSYAQ